MIWFHWKLCTKKKEGNCSGWSQVRRIGIYSYPMHPIHLVGLYTARLPVSDGKQGDTTGFWLTVLDNPRCFKLHRTYSTSFNSTNVGQFFWSWILKDCSEVQEKKKKVLVSSSPILNKTWSFFKTSQSWDEGNEMYKNRDARVKLLFCWFTGLFT